MEDLRRGGTAAWKRRARASGSETVTLISMNYDMHSPHSADVAPRQRVEVEVDQRFSVVIPSLEEIDAIVRDEVDDPVLLSQASRPDIRAQMPEGLRLAEP